MPRPPMVAPPGDEEEEMPQVAAMPPRGRGKPALPPQEPDGDEDDEYDDGDEDNDDDEDEGEDEDDEQGGAPPPARSRRPVPAVAAGGAMGEVPVDGNAVLKAIRTAVRESTLTFMQETFGPTIAQVNKLYSQTAELTKAMNIYNEEAAETRESHENLRKAIEEQGEGLALLKSLDVTLKKAMGGSAATTETQVAPEQAAETLLKAITPPPAEAEPKDAEPSAEKLSKAIRFKTPDGKRLEGVEKALEIASSGEVVPMELRKSIIDRYDAAIGGESGE